MTGDDDLQRLEGRLAALNAEQAARSAEVEATCREKLAAPGTLIGAAAVGAMLGLLGGSNKSAAPARSPPPPPPTVTAGGATILGAVVALAGLAGAVLRIVEIGVLAKSATDDRPRR